MAAEGQLLRVRGSKLFDHCSDRGQNLISMNAHTRKHTPLFRDYPGEPVPER